MLVPRAASTFTSPTTAAACDAVLASADERQLTTRELVYALKEADHDLSQAHIGRLLGISRQRVHQLLTEF